MLHIIGSVQISECMFTCSVVRENFLEVSLFVTELGKTKNLTCYYFSLFGRCPLCVANAKVQKRAKQYSHPAIKKFQLIKAITPHRCLASRASLDLAIEYTRCKNRDALICQPT